MCSNISSLETKYGNNNIKWNHVWIWHPRYVILIITSSGCRELRKNDDCIS